MQPLRPARVLSLFLLTTLFAPAQRPTVADKPILWSDPGQIQSRNLYWGPGGQEHQPKTPVQFEKEDRHGTSPKFDVHDSEDKKWSAKLGLEARPETVASRLMWAVGYAANENYFFPHLQVTGMPAKLKRGQRLAGADGDVPDVRLQRRLDHLDKVSEWNWRHNPFYGTREFNGLRVMMALIGNWDLKDNNNAVLRDKKESAPDIYEVTDVGTALGTAGKSYNDKDSKGNLAAYQHTKLIAHVHGDFVDLNFPRRPPFTELLECEWAFYFHQIHIRWIGRDIPRSDAKWIGSLLAQLTPDQIRDAFRAADYPDAEIDAYTKAVLSRIQELNSL